MLPLNLRIFLTLSFFGGIFGILFSLMGLLGYDVILSLIPEYTDGIVLSNSYYLKMSIILILFLLSIFGVYKMWKRKKIGFYIYCITNIIFLPLFFNFFAIIITIVFIIIYWSHIKIMT